MPTGASVDKMENDVLVHEQQITLHLSIEFVGKVNTAHVVWATLGPHATYLAGVTDFRDEVEHLVRYSNSLQEPAHDILGRMPPADVELPESESVSSRTAGAEESDNSTDVKVGPV